MQTSTQDFEPIGQTEASSKTTKVASGNSEMQKFLAVPEVAETIKLTIEEDEWIKELEMAQAATERLINSYFLDSGEGLVTVETQMTATEVEWVEILFEEALTQWLSEKAEFQDYEVESEYKNGWFTITVESIPDDSDCFMTKYGFLDRIN